MLSEKDSGTLRDILRHIDLAEQFAYGKGYEGFRDDLQAHYAPSLQRLRDNLEASDDNVRPT
jgi:hypothetical protein